MEEELQRPATSEAPEARKTKAPIEPAREKVAPPPLPSMAQRRELGVEAAPVRERAVARITPTNPMELPSIHEDTIYACITSEALRASGKETSYRVPEGFVALLSEPDGRFRSTMLAGEEARGSFLLHLFRTGTQNLAQSIQALHSKDGFDLSANISYSCRFPDGDSSAMQDFLFSHVLGRTHFSGALLKSDLQKEARRALAEICAEMNATDLVAEPRREAFEPPFLLAMRKRLAASGIEVRGLDGLRFVSRDLEQSKREDARQERRAQDSQKREEVRAVIAREKIGAELSRQELSAVLDSIRQKRELTSLEQEQERLQRQMALESLEREYRSEENNLDAALRKMLAKNEMEIDRLKFEEYLRMTSEVRDRLQEDRIEFYINQIQDETLKARLLLRLMERDMTPEQLSELADLERARAEAGQRSEPTKDSAATSEPEEEKSEEAPAPSFKLAFANASAPDLAISERAYGFSQHEGQRAQNVTTEAAPISQPFVSERSREIAPPPLPSQRQQAPEEQRQARRNSDMQTFLVTAGRRVVSIDASPQGSQQQLFADLSSYALGSLRSLRVAKVGSERIILAGARRGVYRLDPHGGAPILYPIDSGIAPQTGVNSTLIHQGSIYATHSQFGLLRWSLNAQNFPATRVAERHTQHAQTVRGLFLDDGTWPTFACGNRIIAIEHDLVSHVAAVYSGAPSEILAIAAYKDRFYAACRSGEIVFWDKSQPNQAHAVTRLESKLFSASIGADEKSFVLISRDSHVRLLDLSKGVLARYDAPTEVVMAQDFGSDIAAIARDRGSLFLWDSFGGGQPYLEIHLSEPPYDIAKL